MPNINVLTAISTATNTGTYFVISDKGLARRIRYDTLLNQVNSSAPGGGRAIFQISSGTYSISINEDGSLVSSDGILKVADGISIDEGRIRYTTATNTFFVGDTDSTSTHFVFLTQSPSQDPYFGFSYVQHHNSQVANGMILYRGRGTYNVPEAVQNGDQISKLLFVGFDGTTNGIASAIATIVTGEPVSGSGNIAGELVLSTNGGFGLTPRARISSTGTFKTNKIGDLTTGQVVLESDVEVKGILTINGVQVGNPATIIQETKTPASVGNTGDMSYDSTNLYICVSTNTWIRVSGVSTAW